MPVKKRSSNSSNSSIIDLDEQSAAKKKTSQEDSAELALFYQNCQAGGAIHSAIDENDHEVFDKTVERALQ